MLKPAKEQAEKIFTNANPNLEAAFKKLKKVQEHGRGGTNRYVNIIPNYLKLLEQVSCEKYDQCYSDYNKVFGSMRIKGINQEAFTKILRSIKSIKTNTPQSRAIALSKAIECIHQPTVPRGKYKVHASKLLHICNPELPIWDSIVAKVVFPKGMTWPSDDAKYKYLCDVYDELRPLAEKDGWGKRFTEHFRCGKIGIVKVIDFVLWAK